MSVPVIIMIVLLLIQMMIKVPVAVAMGTSSLIYLVITGSKLSLVSQYLVSSLNSFTFLAIPFFVLAGELMNFAGISEKIIGLAKVFVGHIKGGLALVNVLTSVVLAGMSGSSVSDAAMTCRVLVPEMEKEGYPRPYSAALTASSATLGPIIPPSIPMVLLGGINQLSVGRLFLGGIGPGFLLAGIMVILVYFQAIYYKFPCSKRANLSQLYIAGKKAFLPTLTPVIILGGMMFGLFTPTEAAVVAVMYILFLGVVVYRTLNLSNIFQALLNTVNLTSRIMFIVAFVGVFGWILTVEQITNKIGDYLSVAITSPFLVLIFINILMLFLGCFMNVSSIIVLLSPIVFPIIYKFGIDPIYFGVIMVFNLEIGSLTPPVGVRYFVVLSAANVKFKEFFREMIPHFIILFIVLALMIIFPKIILFIPNLIMGKRLL